MSVLHLSTATFLALLLVAPCPGDTVILSDGKELEGTILKQNETTLWLDIGPKVIELDNNDVQDVVESGDDEVKVLRESLFHTVEEPRELSAKLQAQRVSSSVIKVRTPGAIGSGVIINEEGYAITNAHVIQGEQDLRAIIWVPQPDGTKQRTTVEDVEIIAVNNHLDLALLKMSHPDKDVFPYSPIESWEGIMVGQPVFAIGNPLNMEQSMTEGVISTTQRNFDGLSYIQTDTPINPGNSGGPLFNTKGEVIGITNMGIPSGDNLGFAIPARYVKDFIRNREAFAYDAMNPNAGHNYQDPPVRSLPGAPPQLQP
ncbi:MAG: trypsin-like peptidase domain-containing protein [Planctomycetota bacterium]|nr:trypsin-like peptidase domain-containing protein [Planctomycetota bacterium]